MFDSSSSPLLSSDQLAAALIHHLNKSSLHSTKEGCDEANDIIENDDFPVEVQAMEIERTTF